MAQLVNGQAGLEARRGGPSSPLVTMRGADPASDDDLATLRYCNAHYGGGGVEYQQVDVFNVAVPGTTVFNLTHTPNDSSTVLLFVNGIAATIGADFSCVGQIVTWLDVGYQLSTGDVVVASYEKI